MRMARIKVAEWGAVYHCICHVVLETKRCSVPPLYASQKLPLKLHPD